MATVKSMFSAVVHHEFIRGHGEPICGTIIEARNTIYNPMRIGRRRRCRSLLMLVTCKRCISILDRRRRDIESQNSVHWVSGNDRH